MTSPNDPAFVQRKEQCDDGIHAFSVKDGLTKREYFAAMAMQGILANIQTYEKGHYQREGVPATPSVTILALDVADNLIIELNKGTK